MILAMVIQMKKPQNKSDSFWDNFNDWICYWRLNIHRFVGEYLGLNVHIFQQILLYLMDAPRAKSITSFIFFASRGLGKSWLTMVFCIAKCILYPGIQIKVASSTIRQAVLFINKVNEIKDGHPNIEREIEDVSVNKDGGIITFRGGSKIEAVVCSDNARGHRANIVICDESRLMDKEMINRSLMPFLTLNNRNQPWAGNKKYKKYLELEHNSKIYLTSIGYKDEWSYTDFEDHCQRMAEGRDDYFALSLPYQFGVEAGVISKSYIESTVRDGVSDIKGIQMEFEVIPHGESENAMFTFDEVNSSRQLRVPLIPPTDDEYIDCRGNLKLIPTYQKKEIGEIRVISMDIAVAAGRKNDLTVFTVFRCTESVDYYDKELSYQEVMSGVNLDAQIVRLKQLFYDLDCNFAVIDATGAIGIQAVNECGNVTKDLYRNKKYPGWKTMNKVDKFDMRITDPNAEPVLFPIQVAGAGASSMQYNMLVIAQLEFQRKRLSLLVDEDTGADEMNKRYKYMTLKTSMQHSDKEKAENMIVSYINTSELVNECVKTQVIKLPSGRFTYDEKGGRKDRVISMIYGLYFINKLEEDLIVLNKSIKVSEYGNTIKPTSTSSVINPFVSNLNKLGSFGRQR